MSRSELQFSVPAAGADPIDWAHLERATLGDRPLANEVLRLFLIQAASFVAEVHDSPEQAVSLAHKLKGSARGIGAWPVADAAQDYEAALSAAADAGPSLAVLLMRITVARSAITAHLNEA